MVTFSNVLRDGAFPLADAVNLMLTEGQKAMQRPVEIEFAGNIDGDGALKGRIYWLQIRPIIDRKDDVDEELLSLPDENLILRSTTALGAWNHRQCDAYSLCASRHILFVTESRDCSGDCTNKQKVCGTR